MCTLFYYYCASVFTLIALTFSLLLLYFFTVFRYLLRWTIHYGRNKQRRNVKLMLVANIWWLDHTQIANALSKMVNFRSLEIYRSIGQDEYKKQENKKNRAKTRRYNHDCIILLIKDWFHCCSFLLRRKFKRENSKKYIIELSYYSTSASASTGARFSKSQFLSFDKAQ